MRPLVDPSLLTVGPLSLAFLVVAGLLLPAAAIAQQRTLDTGHPDVVVTRARIYASAFLTHVGLVAGAVIAAREMGADLFPAYRFAPWHAALAVAVLGVGLVPLLRAFDARDPRLRARAALIAPRTPRERAQFAGVAVAAGVAEEIAYRGVLPLVLARLLGGWWLPAIASAAAFGAAHAFQGRRGALLATAIGLIAQALVGLTGTLLLAMLVHAVHDIIAGLVISRRARLDTGGPSVAVP